MTDTKAPGGLNVWQIATTLVGALLVAAVFGLFAMRDTQTKQQGAIDQLTKDVAKLQDKQDKDVENLATFKEATNLRLNTVDNLKTSFDNLNRYAQERR